MALGIYYGMFHVHADMVDSNYKLAIIRKPPPNAVRIIRSVNLLEHVSIFIPCSAKTQKNTFSIHFL